MIHGVLISRVCSLFDSLNLLWRYLEVVSASSLVSLIGSVNCLIPVFNFDSFNFVVIITIYLS